MEIIEKQISEHIHSIKIPFRIPVGPDIFVERFVYVHLIYEDSIYLIDSGVSGSENIIFDYITKTKRNPSQIAMIVLTHAHADHIGGALAMRNSTKCTIAAHNDDIKWIEDTELQLKERPIPGFSSLITGPVKVDHILKDGDLIELSEESSLEVIHTPGHSKGHIALYYKKDGAIITGDCVPVRRDMPVYDDVKLSMDSINKLLKRSDIAVLLSAWAEPGYNSQAYKNLQDGLNYIMDIHREVNSQKTKSQDVKTIAGIVCKKLGLPESTMNPLFFNTIAAHLKQSV